MTSKLKSVLAFSSFWFSFAAFAQAPSLPPGLGEPTEPSLPAGLAGLDDPEESARRSLETQQPSRPKSNVRFNATLDSIYGSLLQSNPHSDDDSLSEIRLQTRWTGSTKALQYRLSTDWVADFLADTTRIDLRSGQGWIDPREAWISAQPIDFIDLKVGRQIATWGTGDLLFISDLFPKDWQALLLGRDEEYLKAPSDAIKVSVFTDPVNIDIVYTPEFDPDRFVTGERISYFDSQSNSIQGKDQIVQADYPSGGELSTRLHRLFGNAEIALYAHKGYWKQPAGFDDASRLATFPKLNAYSASWRRPFADGIANLEAGYYRSADDPDGMNRNVRNSEYRFLAGYERELATNLTGSFQYYIEQIADYDNLLAGLSSGQVVPNRTRTLLTARLTQLLMRQDLRLSLFAFYSPSDNDVYLRPQVSYRINDLWKVSGGANLFHGKKRHTFFGQFEESSNAYFAVRRSFN